MSRSVTSLLDLGAEDVRALTARAAAAQRGPPRPRPEVVAVLPFGPRDEPPAAWIAAASRLGCGVLRADDCGYAGKDPFEIAVEAARWADLLVVSHPSVGFARAVADLTSRPVVNAGESGGEDPAAGISLLAAVRPAESAEGPGAGRLRAAVCGDLVESRSARAFLAGLAAAEATVLLVPAKGRDLPEDEVARVARRMGRQPLRFEAHAMSSLLDMVDTVLLAPEESPQLPLFREVGVPPDEAARRARREVEDLDVLFVAAGAGARDRLVREPFRRSRARGLPHGAEHTTSEGAVRALLEFALDAPEPPAPTDAAPGAEERYRSALGLSCRGERCVAARTPERVAPDFLFLSRVPPVLECLYCGARTGAEFAASKLERRFHEAVSPDAQKILPANLVLFRTRVEATASGFEPPRRRSRAEGDPRS